MHNFCVAQYQQKLILMEKACEIGRVLGMQCVANVIFLGQMNIQIYPLHQNLTNISKVNIFVYRYSNIQIYSNI